MDALNPQQLYGALRIVGGYAVAGIVNWLISHGVLPADQASTAQGALLTILSFAVIAIIHVAYAIWANRTTALIKTVQASPTTQVLTTDPNVKAAVPGVELVQKV